MGRKRSRPGQRLHVYIAGLMCLCLLFASCASPIERPHSQQEADERRHLLAAQVYLAGGDYGASIKESETVLTLSAGAPPADEALFTMGLTYADPGNPNKNYGKSVTLFKQVFGTYPQSAYAHQAKVWVEVLRENIRMKQTVAETRRDNDRLKKVLEESKKIDVETGEKMRERTR